jgi:hypothetical protein
MRSDRECERAEAARRDSLPKAWSGDAMKNGVLLFVFLGAQSRMLELVPMGGSSRLESLPMIDRVRGEFRERSGAKHWPVLLWMLLCSHHHPRTLSQA